MTQVFLSHSTHDAKIALRLAEDLRAAGIPVWKAPESILEGEEWVEAIQRGLTTSTHFLLIQSPAAVESQWVNFEFNGALTLERQDKMRIIPILYEPCEPPFFWTQFQQAKRIVTNYQLTLQRLIGRINDEQPKYPPEPTTSNSTINIISLTDVDELLSIAEDTLYVGQPIEPPEPEPYQEETLQQDYSTPPPPVSVESVDTFVPREIVEESPERDEPIIIEPPVLEPYQKELPVQREEPSYQDQAPVQVETRQEPRESKSLPILPIAGIGGMLVVAVIIGVMAITGVFKVDGGKSEGNSTAEATGESVVSDEVTEEATVTEVVIILPENPDTPTPTTEPTKAPTLTAGEVARQFAEAGVSANDDWTVYTEVFGGAEMALVPAGCFMMGSESGGSDESPIHEVCFDEPFWIDVTEVTNRAYGSSGYFDLGDNHPREFISWTDSDAHCQSREARLPTEAEWEYAAAGVDSLIYPWGDEFVGDNAVYSSNSGGQTVEVGSRPGGISWIGAYDLSGNVSERVNDSYDSAYYGTLEEGIINPQGPASGTNRVVLRGGSWYDSNTPNLRAANRIYYYPNHASFSPGFRCARSYE